MSYPMIRVTLALALSMGLAACAHVPPQELVNARAAYKQAANGPALTSVPAELHKAEEALKAAEAAYEDDWKGYHTRDLAYVAQRKAQYAAALALVATSEADAAKAKADYDEMQGKMLANTQNELAASQSALATSSTNLANANTNLTAAEKAAADAKKAAADADARTAAALAELAAAKEEARGLVITLSGSVLFRTNESALLPEAQTRLNQVADALLTKPKRTLVIEGHTDNRGDDAANLKLSQARAESVRSYLVSRGYDAALIQANGIGEARPIADNTSPEGMSNNRRVEIVISK